MCIPSGNHDMGRLSQTLDTDEQKLAFAFLLSMPGAPFIYYGDEIGMRYLEGITSVEGGYGRTGSRSPMQWNKGLNAGFSSAAKEKLYIPLDDDPKRPDAESQMADPDSLRSEIKRLIALRMAHSALQSRASIQFVQDGYPLIYDRQSDDERITIVINPSADEKCVSDITGTILHTTGGHTTLQNNTLTIDGCTAVFIRR